MRTKPTWNTTLALLLLLPLAACGAEETTEDAMDMEEAPAAEAETAMDDADAMMEPMTVAFEAKNESGVMGEATATHHGDSVAVAIQISGASEDGEFPAHVHGGDCMAPGDVLAPLNTLAVSGGSGNSTTELLASQVPADQGAVIQVHAPDGQPVACADLSGHGEMDGAMDEDEMGGDEMGGEMGGDEMEGGGER